MDNIQKHFSAAALCAAFLFFAAFASFGQNVIYSCGFEDATENANWILANGDQTNQWYIGTAANNGGSNGLYISNDGGASNAYDNTSTSYVYAYREINVTETAWYNLELDWRLNGQYYYDIMRMFLIPESVNPDLSAGNPNGMEYSPYSTPSGWIGATGVLYGYSEWTHVFIEQEIEAGTYYLVLFWKNNNSYGDNPPAAIDNISITKNNCVSLSDVWVEDIVAESATIVWEERGTATSWDIVISLDYLEDADLESADFITVTDMTYSLTGLEPLTYYYIYVRASCSNDEHSLWKSTSFETPRIPATLPYSFGFEDDTENANWELSDEADNLWAIGTAVSNGGEKGLYISENRGISNTYNNSKQSYAYAFRTINITEPDEYQFDFDWRANGGDSGYDLLRAFVIPTSLDPSISYGYHNDMYSNYNDAPSGWIDASADGLMSGQPRWQHSSKVLDLDAGTYYFVFFWKNSDGGDGTNPPAAIDNISIQRVINPAVATFSVSSLNSTSATLHGNILSQGASDITARGFEYGTDSENLSENTQSTDDTDEFSSTIIGLAPNTTYYYRAYATNSEGTGYGTIKSFTTNGSYSGFDFVDLGLPSKTYWATMNVGATSTEDMGDYFAWGETTPKDTYEWSTYQYCNGSDESMTKYCNNPDFGDNGFTDNLTTLEASDDAATANWGSGWRMPIADEAEELYTYCSHVWTTQNGVTGRLFTGPNGRSIFLPGIYNGMSNHYWTNSLYSSYPSEATTLLFGSGTRAELGDYYRYDGLPVRAVYRMAPYLATVSQSNVTLSSATLSGLFYDNGNSDVIERGFQYGTNPDNLTETIQSELGANEFTATLTGLAPNTTYYYRAYATNSDDTGYGEIKSFRTPSGQLGDHYYVNLGLPSGTMWATCNVGGTNFEDLGNEYAWGETTTKDEYTQNNYTYSDNPATLPADADAAAVNWGEDWIMPTQEDIQELIDYCNTTWITINGIRGMQATSSNGNSIFIPTNIYEGYSTSGNYWSSSLYTDNPTSAMYMSLYSGDSESDSDVSIWDSERSNPARVRPVYKVAPTAFELGDEPYSCDFENADENAQWVLANGRQPSKWYIGTAASNGGANGLYISADDGAHNSYNFAEPSSTYAYRLINITTADLYQFDFDWRAAGNEDYDYLRAFLIPASIDPDLAPGASYDPDWINICSTEIMSEQPEWQHSRTAVNIEETGMYYLAFFWENDDYYYGNNPSAAIDNISICKATNFFIDNRDGNIYSFVTIGDQTWLAENLRYAGNIQLGTEISETVPYLYYPDGNEYNVSTYGYLYNWPAAMNGEESSYEIPSGVQGICPEGWHLPSEQEWVQLDDYLGRNNTGSMLAGYADSWFYGSLKQSEYFGATGFNALPAGVYSGTSIEFGHITRFWTTTTSVNNSDLIYHKDIISTYTTLYSDLNSKDFGNSVRCVRNTGSIAATLPYDCDFEDDTENANWVLDNGNQTNKWYIGTTANNGGENGLYISNDGGISNTYSGTETRVYAYRDILVPDGTTDLMLSFDWKAKGGSRNYEFLRVYWLDPEVATVTAGDNPPTINGVDYDLAGQPGSYGSFANSHWLSQQNTWQHEVMIISADQFTDMGNGDKIYRLYFHWRNINYSSQPPAAVDNVHLEQIINPIVATSSVSDISATSATLHGSILSHGTSDITVRGFEYGTDEGNLTEIVQSTDETNDFSVLLTNLASSTTYYYRAYATNSNGTGYGELVAFNTKCSDEDMCEISYSLADSYGDGWNGCAINVVDVETEIVIATLTFDDGFSATGTLEVCDGREIIFEWVEGEYPEETIYQIFDVNGDEIFSGTGTMYSSVSYTMSCSSCRVVADFTIANITTESATINFTGQGTATSWELIVSETELDDADLENYNNAIILTEPSYSATGLPIATQYYVYVRSVCPNDDKSSWKKGAFNTKICPDEDMCGISYELASEISIGWSGGAINIVDVESEIAIATLTINQGYSATGIVDVCDGKEIRIDYTAGQYPDFVSYHIFDANGDVIDSYYGLDSPTSHSQLYTVSCPTCRPVKNIHATEITTESATIRWADYGSAESWEIIVSDEEIDDNALDSNGAIVQSADSTYVATGLTSSTYYYVYVHALCLGSDESKWRSYSFTTPQIPAIIPYTCDFEDVTENTNWTLANGDQTNQWHIGSTANNGGENGLYISNDDGVSNEYDNHSTSDVYAYRTIDIDENAFYEISFDWRSNGRGTSYYSDFLDVFLAPVSSGFDLSGGNQPNYLTYDWIYLTENLLAGATSWQNFTKIINIDEGRYNLVFYWRNSSIDIDSGHPADNPPAAIDNISIKVNEVATIPYTCDFEDATENDNWILANENQTNQWYIGSAANNGGENGLYISDDDGTSNEYDINSPSVVYAYRTIDIDEDDIYEISFDWRSNGDGDTPSALLGVFLAPVSSDFNLVGGNDLDNLDDWIIITEEPLADATSWQNFTKIINIEEGSYNLIFYWANRNDGGENPPAAIDNISINSLTLDISVDYPMDRSTTSANIKIHYTNLTYTENSLLFHYGTNRNNINHRVEANYESTNEFFYAEITNLEPDTKYYYYAEEISEFGTLLSDTLSFYTYGSFIDDRDNHQYSTIRIGNQIWMAEDLEYAGNIPQGTIGETSSTEPYRYPTEYCTEYSTKLYNWPAAMNLAGSSNENPSGVQGVCPNGWHLPSEAEWQELYDTLGGNDRDAGAQLASLFYSDGKPIAESEYTGASGFDVIYSNWYSGSYEGNYENAAFWSATASNTDEAYYHRIYSGSTDLLSGSSEKGYGFNVRCVKGTTYYTFDTIPYCGESYTFGTQIITESGDYTRIVNLGSDTDSIYKLHITFFEIPVATISDFSNGCFGQDNGHATVSVEGGTAPYSYAWNTPEAQTGATLSNLAEGEYTVIVTDANGCSATSSVEITTPDEIAVSIADTACNSYEWNGTTYTETGEYTQTLQTAEGCDSVVTLQLTINHSSTGEFADLMCAGVPYIYGGETFNEAGTYTVTLANSVGCDSVVTLTLTYADNCNGIISGVITDDYTGDFIPNARVTIGNNVTYTNADGQYSLEVLRGRKTLRVSAVEYISHSEIIDVQGNDTINITLNSPRIITSDNISLTTYPYLEQTDTITITNTGNGTLVWSSITEYDGLALVEDSTIQRRNSRSLWDSIQTFATRENAEQAVATDGFFIYTSSWMRPGEFNRYTPNGEYVETFFIENVGMIRNLSYNGNYFYGTDATNVIYKLDLDNQTLLGSIETDIPEIRHCSFNRQDGSILAGDWNSLYNIDTTSGTSQQIRSDLANVYSSAFDNLSAGGPYLWLFSQNSQDNGPSACIRQFDISANDFTDKIHYLDDIEISDASLAGGICASEYVCEGKFVLLTNVQNPSGNNTIATYEIGRTNSVARAERKSGTIAPNESENIPVRVFATETGEYASTIRYRAAVMGRQSNDVIVNISAIAPECDAVQQITASTDNSTITLKWQPVELGEYESVSYLVYNTASQYAIDTLSETSATYRGLPNGEHCFYVRALSSSSYTCLSEASNTVCAEIKDSPCDIPLFVEARSDGETITVSWNPPADVDHFSIYRDGESIAENITTTNFVDRDVVPETDYCYTVVAHLESGSCNEISGTTCMRILNGVCTEASALTADALGNSVILKWTECDGAVNYRIFRDNEFIGTTTDIYYTDNVHETGNYCYVVESNCEHRMYKLSNEECVSADAIAEWSADNLTLYPNPTYSQFFIEGQRIATVQIFNAIGQLVAEIENSEDERITINCNGWNPGLYNVRIISTEGEIATRKVTVFR